MQLSIRTKLITALVAGLVLVAVATAYLMRFVHQRAVERASLREMVGESFAFERSQAIEEERLAGFLDVIMANEELARRFAARDRAALRAEAQPVYERLRDLSGVTHWTFHSPDPADGVFLRMHRPEESGDRVLRPSFLQAVATGREASGRELGRTAYAVRVVRPWRVGGRLIGYVELGIDFHTFLNQLRSVRFEEYGVLLAKGRLDRDAWGRTKGARGWNDRAELVVLDTTSRDPEILRGFSRLADVPLEPRVLERMVRRGAILERGAFPLVARDGSVEGVVLLERDVTPLFEGIDDLRNRVVILVALLALGLAAFIVFIVETLIFERIHRMEAVLEALPERLARGDSLADEVIPRNDDEIGRFEAFLARALQTIGSFVAESRRDKRGPPPGFFER
ncbi:MAG TPA: hypothetical protein VLT47_04835 [Anaeromyxobacteraceae bacterium]|nr:hypothetical protein [Anaeromyxobacteraceae bacterium]